MSKCIYKECQFKENYTSMPAYVRAIFIIISFLLTTLNYKTSLSFTTIAILYIPLMNEYKYLAKSGRNDKVDRFHKWEYRGSCVMIFIALLGVISILQMDVSSEINRIYINKEFPVLGGLGVSALNFWLCAAVLTIVVTIIDWQLTPHSNAKIISIMAESEATP